MVSGCQWISSQIKNLLETAGHNLSSLKNEVSCYCLQNGPSFGKGQLLNAPFLASKQKKPVKLPINMADTK